MHVLCVAILVWCLFVSYYICVCVYVCMSMYVCVCCFAWARPCEPGTLAMVLEMYMYRYVICLCVQCMKQERTCIYTIQHLEIYCTSGSSYLVPGTRYTPEQLRMKWQPRGPSKFTYQDGSTSTSERASNQTVQQWCFRGNSGRPRNSCWCARWSHSH